MYITIFLVSLGAAFITLFSGFGLGTLLLPTFAFFFSIEIAVAAAAIVHLANNLFKFILVGRRANLKITFMFALPAALAALFGAWLLLKLGKLPIIATYQLAGHMVHIELIKIIIGILIVVFALFELYPFLNRFTIKEKYIPLGGLISGFIGGFSGLQGALRTMFLMRANLSKEQFIGTSVVSAIIVDLSRITIYGYTLISGHFAKLNENKVIIMVTLAIFASFTGSLIANKLLKKTTVQALQKFIGFLLLLTGLGITFGII